MKLVKYRALRPNLTPRRTRVTVPGWAGQSEPRADGSQEYPWHCIPFSEAARSGFELCYPHEDELRVSAPDGFPIFEGDFGDAADPNARRPPFRTFGRQYYTYQLLLDLKVEYEVRWPYTRFHEVRLGDVDIFELLPNITFGNTTTTTTRSCA